MINEPTLQGFTPDDEIYTRPSAQIIADSLSEFGPRITTMQVKMHRFVLAELNTHRVFSRNSASSRAIPVVKQINQVLTSPAMPVHWGAEQKGMQSGDTLSDAALENCKTAWLVGRDAAVSVANNLLAHGLHKSLINRVLEPYMWHTVIITSTEWGNFFNQRCDPAAQPEMKAAADAMQMAYYSSAPVDVPYGAWHLPYITQQDRDEIDASEYASYQLKQEALKCISVARCARVSYLTHDGIRSHEKDFELYGDLKTNGHWSPFEHVATPVQGETVANESGSMKLYVNCGNFTGWKQFRKEFRGENRREFVPNLPELAHLVQEGQSDA